MIITETDYAWAAGFIDGEGCISLHPNYNKSGGVRYAVLVSASQNDIRPLEKLQKLFGGSITEFEGKVSQWRISNREDARQVLDKILPYMIVKQRVAALVRNFCYLMRDHKQGHRKSSWDKAISKWYYQRIKEMNSNVCIQF